MAAEIKIEPQASTQQLQTVQIDGTQQYYFIQSNGSDSTNQHAEVTNFSPTTMMYLINHLFSVYFE